ncbi:phage portal protein [Streptomyces albulus]|nr:phage portal protein [Streptomyces noursei]
MGSLPQGLEAILERSLGRFTDEYRRFQYIESYANGDQDPPYMPKYAHREYRAILQQSVLNFLPLIIDSVAQQLYVEGHRKPNCSGDSPTWQFWRDNSLDAWQHAAHRDALRYGISYIKVLPGRKSSGESTPMIQTISPLAMSVLYEDPIHDQWPLFAIQHKLWYDEDGQKRSKIFVYDNQFEYTLVGDYFIDAIPNPDSFKLVEKFRHDIGVCPVVRMRNRLDLSPNQPPLGEIEQLIPIQDRLNNFVLSQSMTVQYSSFRQRWATGLAIPEDPKTGQPMEAFNAAVNRLWVSESPDVKFGEFSESDVTKIIAAIDQTVKHMSAISQIPAVYFLGEIANLSAEALDAAEAGLTRKVNEKRTVFGEAWNQVMRLAATAAGDGTELEDFDGRIIWRDTEQRALASTVDALGKLTQMLQIPPEFLWEKIPGWTTQDVEAAKAMSKDADAYGNMMGMLAAQAEKAGLQSLQMGRTTGVTVSPPAAPGGAPGAAGGGAPKAPGGQQATQAGKDNAKPGTNVPGKATTGKAGYGSPSDKINYHKSKAGSKT